MYLDLNVTPKFPLCIEIQTTNVCNARCAACPYPEIVAPKKKHRMPDSLLEKLLLECKEHRDKMSLIIPYFNNEPFADSRMLDILRRIKNDIGVDVEISSNASLLTPEKSTPLISENLVKNLRISFFGSTELSYEQRMKNLNWKKTTANIHHLLQKHKQLNSTTLVEIIMVGTPDLTKDEVDKCKALWSNYNVDVKIFGYLDRANNNQYKNLLPIHQSWGKIVGCELNRPFERMAITVDGIAVLCSQDWREEVQLGNVNNASLKEIWLSEKYTSIRKQISGVELASGDLLCRKCKLAYVE